MNKDKLVTIFFPNSEWKGDLILQYLQDEGISAFLANRSSSYLLGAVPKVDLEILVPEEMAQRAKALIDEVLHEHQKKVQKENLDE